MERTSKTPSDKIKIEQAHQPISKIPQNIQPHDEVQEEKSDGKNPLMVKDVIQNNNENSENDASDDESKDDINKHQLTISDVSESDTDTLPPEEEPIIKKVKEKEISPPKSPSYSAKITTPHDNEQKKEEGKSLDV